MKCPIEPNDRRKAEERNDIMKEQLEAIRAAAKQALSDCADSKLLETLRVQYLGKKGELTGILKQMGKLSAEERPAMGQLANQVRADIENALAEKQKKLADAMLAHKLESETLDITLPGKKQKVGSMHPLTIVENEIREIHRLTDQEFAFVAVKVENWNHDLSPWNAPAVFGTEDFGDGAENTLEEVLQLCTDNDRKYCIGGYSMAGLFALWAAMQTDRFKGVAATSPSVWFPGFLEDMKSRRVGSDCIYLSLGDKEEKTRNPVMAQVGNCIRETFTWLKEEGIPCTLEWNHGGHFKEPDMRTARAFAWVLEELAKKD